METKKRPLRILIADGDDLAAGILRAYIGQMGLGRMESGEIPEVTIAEDGCRAWTILNETIHDLIILDWRVRGLRGLQLFNRLRRDERYALTPMLVLGSELDVQDFRLLEEFPCTSFLKKTPERMRFMARVKEIMHEADWYTANRAKLDCLVQAVGSETVGATMLSRLSSMLERAPNVVAPNLLLARLLREHGHLEAAEAVARRLAERAPHCVLALAELGKILHIEGRFAEASAVLRAAQHYSSRNVERLCMLGEDALNLGTTDDAKNYFSQALAIDHEDSKSQAGLLVAESIEAFVSEHAGTKLPDSLAGFLNVIGISLVKSGKFDQGFRQYEAAMQFVRGEDAQARLAYNLGLGHLRSGRPNQALPWLNKAVTWSHGRLVKADELVTRVRQNAALTEIGDEHLRPA